MEPTEWKTRAQDEPDSLERAPGSADSHTPEAVLRALLADLTTLQEYLDERSHHTYELAQRFMANAGRDASSRAYDERQATMLEYQHYIWSEIASRLSKLVMTYEEQVPADPHELSAPETRSPTSDQGKGE